MVRLEQVSRADELIQIDQVGASYSGKFVAFANPLVLSGNRRGPKRTPTEEIATYAIHALHDLWNISTLMEHLEWLQGLAQNHANAEERWSFYAGLDIEHFHIELRSALDYAAGIIKAVADEPHHVPEKGLHEIKKWLAVNPGNEARLGSDLAAVVTEAAWFPGAKKVRDAIVQGGVYGIVFGQPSQGILFEVVDAESRGIVQRAAELLWNENVVDFKAYAAYLTAEFLCFLDDLAVVVETRIGLDKRRMLIARGAGFRTIAVWLDMLDARVRRMRS